VTGGLHPLLLAELGAAEDWNDYERAVGRIARSYSPPDARVEELTVAGGVRVRSYAPTVPAEGRPGLLWLHGGGFGAGDLDMRESDVVARELTARADAVVVAVDYRLAAPGTRFPAALDDVEAAWRWFAASAHDLGCEPRRLSLGGASAGGNLAVAGARRLRDRGGPVPAALLLGYPCLHFPTPATAHGAVLPDILTFPPERFLDILRNYLGRIDDIPADAMPGHGVVAGLPPTHLALGEVDDLRGSGELFARQLAEAGIAASVDVAVGMPHGHFNIPPVPDLPEIGRSLDVLAQALVRAGGR
jgi:acetyl esterase/lipase